MHAPNLLRQNSTLEALPFVDKGKRYKSSPEIRYRLERYMQQTVSL